MSAPSTRRLKDRNAVVLPNSKIISPIITTKNPNPNPNPILRKSSSGKENPRSKSNPRSQQLSAQKPTVRSLPRVEKSVAVDDGRMRSSMSSVPRGRSPSPSQLLRVFNDNKKDKSLKVFSEKEKSESVLSKVRALSVKRSSSISISSNVKDSNFSVESSRSRESKVKGVINHSSKFCDEKNKKVERNRISVDSIKESSNSNASEKGVSEGGNKYPSKLHEKLAFLEGKVKRIASDIKKTKEMLDLSNPDASKIILSDIQDKISGIEKAMNHVVVGDSEENKCGEHGSGDAKLITTVDKKECEENGKVTVKRINKEDLEARLFPHHQLLRDRTSKASSGSSQINKLPIAETDCDENPIALEFLSSLKKEDSKTIKRDGLIDLKCYEAQDMDGSGNSGENDSSSVLNVKKENDLVLTTDETIDDEFEDQENIPVFTVTEEIEDTCNYQLNLIGTKNSTAGWFVSEGEAVLLAHDDGSCSYYDVANGEEKISYKPPEGLSPNIWKDCWIIRAPGADGCSGRYVVAASAGNVHDSGFCSWDFYNKDVKAFRLETNNTLATSRTILGPLNNSDYRRNALWYKPCGPLMVSASASHRLVKAYDIRDGEKMMEWELQKPVLAMEHSSPVQWRNKGKVVLAESEIISVWDVNSNSPQALLSISLSGKKISALHVNNTDAELGGGIRHRVSSSTAEGNDGVYCTTDSINIMDFRHPTGVGIQIPKTGFHAQSVYSNADSVFIGCNNVVSAGKREPSSQVQQFSLHKQRLVSTYTLPESDSPSHQAAITQVWGNSNHVMGVSELGLFMFDALEDDHGSRTQKVKEVIGADNMCSPSFDYLGSRILLISRDRPASWRYLQQFGV
ncbi:hypothetical protein ACFE04_015008 [Oxalis oulophora]